MSASLPLPHTPGAAGPVPANPAGAASPRPADQGGFRPDLEGLRAVAVVLVLLYHAHIPGFPGGFVGVDVFFVLSGFLITGLLLRELEATGTIALAQFYARRARRLLPAALLVLLLSAVASRVILPPLRMVYVAGDHAAAALYGSNLRYAAQATDYLRAARSPSPALHYWSLSLEEQFYFLWPLLVLLAWRGARRLAGGVGGLAAGLGAGSLALGIWLTSANAPLAFFLLPARAWELAIGALLAAAGPRPHALPAWGRAAAGWAGLVLVGLSAARLTTETPFPGLAALAPALGTALCIAAGGRHAPLGPARLLGLATPRFLGRISYSLYLWHWPVLTLASEAAGQALPGWQRVALLGVAVALATVSQRYVEEPLRHGRWVGTRPAANLGLGLGCSLAVAALALGLGASARAEVAVQPGGSLPADEMALDSLLDAAGTGPRGPTPDAPVPVNLRPPLARVDVEMPAPYRDGCHVDLRAVESPACIYGLASSRVTVVLFGDSHALSWWPAMERLALERGWRLVSLTKSACPSADVTSRKESLKRAYTECEDWRRRSIARIATERPALVVLANSEAGDLLGPDGTLLGGEAGADAWREGLVRTVRALEAAGARRVAIVADVPRARQDVPECLSQARTGARACATPLAETMDPARRAATTRAAALSGATFVDPTRWICPTEPCPAVIGNFLVLRDEHHLAPPFARALASRLAAALPTLEPAADGPASRPAGRPTPNRTR